MGSKILDFTMGSKVLDFTMGSKVLDFTLGFLRSTRLYYGF